MTMANYVHHQWCHGPCGHWDCVGCCGCYGWYEGIWYFDDEGTFHDITDHNDPDYEPPKPIGINKIKWEFVEYDDTEYSPEGSFGLY